MKRAFSLLATLLLTVSSFATTKVVTVDGLKYSADAESKTARLVGNDYSGYITVPASFTDDGVTYRVTSISDECFQFCTGLTGVTLPSSVTQLGDYCFRNCTGLTSITLPDTVTSLGLGCFSGCSGLTHLTLPSSVTQLGYNCFESCTGLTSIVLPASITQLSGACFRGCTSLNDISIPASVTSIGDECFYNCTRLKGITLSSSLTTLGMSCFEGCSDLTSITIPAPVISIGLYCFRGCSSLTSMTCLAQTPPSVTGSAWTGGTTSAFEGLNTSACTLYVPDVTAYKAAEGWKDFKYIYKITTGISLAKTRHVVVAVQGGIVRLSGLSDGEPVQFYSPDGQLLGSQRALSGTAVLSTSAPLVVCKVGDTSLKVRVK